MATITGVSAPAKSGELLSERIAPGILPKVLGRFDMIAIFVAIVLFAGNGLMGFTRRRRPVARHA